MIIVSNYANFLVKSCTSTKFYTTIHRYSNATILLFWITSILLSSLLSLFALLTYVPKYERISQTLLSEAVTHYPQKLEVTWDGTNLESTSNLLVIEKPKDLTQELKHVESLAVIQTNVDTVAEFTSSSDVPTSLIAISKLELGIRDATNGYTTVPLADVATTIPEFVINTDNIETIGKEINSWYYSNKVILLTAFSVLFIFSLLLSGLIFTLYSLLLTSFIFFGTRLSFNFSESAVKFTFVLYIPAVIISQLGYLLSSQDYQIGTPLIYVLLLSYILFAERYVLLKKK